MANASNFKDRWVRVAFNCGTCARGRVGIWLGLLVSLLGLEVRAGEALPDGWLQDAKAAWSREMASPPVCRCDGYSVTTLPDEVLPVEEYRFHLERNGESIVYVENREENRERERRSFHDAWGRNASYVFDLSRDSSSSPWVTRNIAARNLDTPASEEIDRYLHIYAATIDLHSVLLLDESLPELFNSPHMTIESAAYANLHESRVAEVHFLFDAPSNFRTKALGVGSFGNVKSGIIFLSPDQNWKMLKGEVTLKDATRIAVMFEDNADSKTGIRSRTLEYYQPDPAGQIRLDFSNVQYDCVIPDSAFTLTAFGLPEPTDFGSNRSMVPWVFAIFGVLAVIAGVWLLRNSKAHQV
ncbi:MAG: hypothetical protein R3C99_24500 [Pirellulaceae bacterium]